MVTVKEFRIEDFRLYIDYSRFYKLIKKQILMMSEDTKKVGF